MSLLQWQNNGWLRPHVTDKIEIANLLDFVKELRKEVLEILAEKYPELLP
jgi:hypothetical protein